MLEMKCRTADGNMFLSDIANAACKYLPGGCEIQLCMENRAAWVTLTDQGGNFINLPDAADKSLETQIYEALCVANGWAIEDD